jgi:hypothetical protein
MTTVVYIQDKNGKPLMPTRRLGKVRRWIKSGRAVIVRYEPFTIRLTDMEGGYTQPLTAGIDSGTGHIGVAVVSEAEEVFSAQFELRTDITDLLTERRQFRRARRGRKTRYRAPRFLNRNHVDPLAPSVRAKVEETRKVLALIDTILPIRDWVVELGNFDPHKLKNPAVSGAGYQQGDQFDFANAREYVLHRDRYICQACKGKSGDRQLQVHHLQPRSEGGSDRVVNLITLCATCHHTHHHGKPLKLRRPESFRDATQFNIVKATLRPALSDLNARITFGYITKVNRHALDLPKSHRNDAFVIAGGSHHNRALTAYLGVFVRRQNRKLYKGDRSHIRNTIPGAFGFKRGDRVRLPDGTIGFIYGLRSSGYFDVRCLDGTKLHASAKAATLHKLETARTLRIQRFSSDSLSVKENAHSSPV